MSSNVKKIHFKIIDSTHLYSIRAIENGDIKKLFDYNKDDALIISAERQSNGVGKIGKSWESIKGNLLTSIIIKNNNFDLGKFSLSVACAIRETVAKIIFMKLFQNDELIKDLKLKWPNDILYQYKKIGGILLAVCNEYLIISVGINTNHSPDESIVLSSSIKEIVKLDNFDDIDNSLVLSILYKEICDWTSALKNLGFSYIKSFWLRNINKINCNVTIKNGCDSISGFFSDIDDFGRIVLNTGARTVFISSGDLFINKEGLIIQNEK